MSLIVTIGIKARVSFIGILYYSIAKLSFSPNSLKYFDQLEKIPCFKKGCFLQSSSKRPYLSILEFHGEHQLMPVVRESLPVISLGEECRAQIPMSPAFSCLVTCIREESVRKGVL